MRARERLIGLPYARRQMEVERAVAVYRAQLWARTHELVTACEAVRDLPRSMLAQLEFDWLRKSLDLGGDSWSAKIAEITEKPEAAVYYTVKLKSLGSASRPEVSESEQRQIEEAIVVLDRSIHKNRRELKRIERDRRQAAYDSFSQVEERHDESRRMQAHAYPGVVNSMKLESFSAAFARRIVAHHPEWAQLVTPEENKVEGYSIFTLRIDFPSENPGVSEPLTVVVTLDGIIDRRWFAKPGGGVWEWDDIYYFPEPQPDYATDWTGFDRVIKWVEEFMNEEIVAFASDDGDGGSFGAMEVSKLQSGELRKGKRGTIVRSWRGTYDLDLGPEAN